MLKTHCVEPISHSSSRSVFSLPSSKTLRSNLRVSDFAVSNIVGRSDHIMFASNIGVYALVKSVALLDKDGNQVDLLNNVSQAMLTGALRYDRGYNKDFSDKLTGASSAYNISLDQTVPIAQRNTSSLIVNTISDSMTFSLDIQLMLAFLKATPIIPDGLRLVIEYETDYRKVFRNFDSAGQDLTPPSAITINPPLLLVDEILQGQIALMPLIQYFPTQVELVALPQVANGATQIVEQRLVSMLDKFVRRVFVVLVAADPFSLQRFAVSTAQYLEKMNLTVNGRKLLPYSGVDNNQNLKLGMLVDTLGVNFTTCCGGNYVVNAANAGQYPGLADVSHFMNGKLAIAGFTVQQPVSEMSLSYQRTGLDTFPPAASALSVYVIAEVARVMDTKTGICSYR